MDQIEFGDLQHQEKYTPIYLKRQIVVHYILNCEVNELLKDWVIDQIRHMYGTGDGGVGPFSVVSYFNYILQDKQWGGQYYDHTFCFYVGIENYCGKGRYRQPN